MRKQLLLLGTITLCSIALPGIAAAAFAVSKPTVPFGGRILTTKVPTVTCTPPGTGPVVLVSNLVGLGSAVYSSVDKNQKGFQKAGNVVSGAYATIPLYTTDPMKTPRAGQWILGRHDMIPDMGTCFSEALSGAPIPVKKTMNYSISGQSWGK